MIHRLSAFLLACLLSFLCSPSFAQGLDEDLLGEGLAGNDTIIADPLEPLNRVFFQFNDRLYFWVLKPLARTYEYMVADDITTYIGNAFRNALAPIRIVNNALQGKFHDSGIETVRFVVNTLAGAGGIVDPAKDEFNLTTKDEDFGQTLGTYKIGEMIYLCWPVIGPSNVRDTVGRIGDTFLNPITYLIISDSTTGYSVQSFKFVHDTVQRIGQYEEIKQSAFDPYTAMRDFYTQSRRSKIADTDRSAEMGAEGAESLSVTGDRTHDRMGDGAGRFSPDDLSDLNHVEDMMNRSTVLADGVMKPILSGAGKPGGAILM